MTFFTKNSLSLYSTFIICFHKESSYEFIFIAHRLLYTEFYFKETDSEVLGAKYGEQH